MHSSFYTLKLSGRVEMQKNELTAVIDAVIGSFARVHNTDISPMSGQVLSIISGEHVSAYSPVPTTQLSHREKSEVEGLIRDLAAATATLPMSGDRETPPHSARSQQSSDLVGQIARSMIPAVGVVSVLGSLFGNSNDTRRPDPLTPAYLPSQISADLTYDANTSSYAKTSYDLNGVPRNSSNERPVQITVNVSAMDSKSFVDHSSDIARAVREAVLNSHSLNDVLSEL